MSAVQAGTTLQLFAHHEDEMTGEEAYAKRCSLTSSNQCGWQFPTNVESEFGSIPRLTSPSRELLQDQPLPWSRNSLGLGPFSLVPQELLLNSQQNSTAVTATLSRPSSRRYSRRSPKSGQQSLMYSLPMIGVSDDIPGLDARDQLDHTIGVRPRFKSSEELQLIMSPSFNGKAPFPDRILRITHQFMIANNFIDDRSTLAVPRKPLRHSLLVRVDLHCDDSPLLRITKDQEKGIQEAAGRLCGYIVSKSKEWRCTGVLSQTAPDAKPIFHIGTRSWLSRDWDGNMSISTADRVDGLLGYIPTLSVHELSRIQKAVGLEIQHISRPDHTNGRTDERFPPNAENVTTLKRPAKTPVEASPSKRRRHGDRQTDLNETSFTGLSVRGGATSKPATLHNQAFSQVVEAVHLAHEAVMDHAPTTAADLAAVQEEWKRHEHTLVLSEALRLGQSQARAMGQYFDCALELLAVLEEGRLRVGAEGLEANYGCDSHEIAASKIEVNDRTVEVEALSPDEQANVWLAGLDY